MNYLYILVTIKRKIQAAVGYSHFIEYKLQNEIRKKLLGSIQNKKKTQYIVTINIFIHLFNEQIGAEHL